MIKMKSFTVTEATRYLKRLMSTDPIINQIIIEGEISNYIRHSSGHAYFTLKDDQSKMACVMFSQYVSALDFNPKNGDRVHAKGQITIYEKDGRYQLNAFAMNNIGLGDLHVKFEALKSKLEKGGLFDSAHKKPIPKLPRKIGILTSPTGAAIQDILSVAKRRNNFSELLIYPIRVQGEQSKFEICKGIDYFNQRQDIDLIILARGGGSIEELWSFNEEVVAYAIYHSEIPIITGVGHETDFTISDFVADQRAATPSAAAEIAIVSKNEMTLDLNRQIQRMSLLVSRRMELERSKLNRFEPHQLSNRLSRTIQFKIQDLNHKKTLSVQNITRAVRTEKEKLLTLGTKLDAMSPFAVMRRGYGIITANDEPVVSTLQLKVGSEIKVRVTDGSIDAEVTHIKKIKGE